MSVKTIANLLTDTATVINDNTTRDISPADVRGAFTDLIDSSVNRITDKPLLNLREYNTGRAYEVGEGAIYLGTIYQCSTNTTGTFTPAHWTAIVGPEVIALTALSDVTITSPVNGQILTYSGGVWINQTPAATGWAINGNTLGNDTSWTGSIDNYDYSIRTNSVERLRVLKGGNVGIGTAAPTAKLHVVGSGNTSATSPFLIQNSDLSVLLTVNDDYQFDATSLSTLNTLRLSGGLGCYGIQTYGRQKIGYSATDYVYGDGRASLEWDMSNGSTAWFMGESSNDITLAVFGAGTLSDHAIIFDRISGRVGIGISNSVPTAKLQLRGVGATSATYSTKIENSASIPLLYIADDGASAFGSGVNTGYQLTVSGNVNSKRGLLVNGTDTGLNVTAVDAGSIGVEARSGAGGYSVYGIQDNAGGRGVFGQATTGIGVAGEVSNVAGTAIYGGNANGSKIALFEQVGTLLATNSNINTNITRTIDLNGFDMTGALLKVNDNTASSGDLFSVIKQSVDKFKIASNGEIFAYLPTSAGTSGSLWNDSGTVKVA
jgi:hypothetical protein